MKNVLIASIAMLSIALTACKSVTNPETGENEWDFAPAEAIRDAVSVVREMPDETKASILDGLGWLVGITIGATGVGMAAVPVCTSAANYYRNRAKSKNSAVATSDTQEGLQQDEKDSA